MSTVGHSYLLRVASARAIAIAAMAILAGCEGTVSVDMATNAAADPAIDQVLVDLEGVEFVDDSGKTESLTFTQPMRADLVDYIDGNLFRLFTDEQLPDGRYTSVRLLFESDENQDDDTVIVASGGEFPLTVDGTATSDVDFTIDEDSSSGESVVLTLDLRQSLSFDTDSREYSLAPVIRGVRAEDTGQIAGTVTVGCPAGTSLAQGGAVYLFTGEDVTPDDRDSQGTEPYLTTAVVTTFAGSGANYSFQFVPEGDYTLALTCRGDDEDASTSDELDFRSIVNVQVDAEETLTHNITI
jgi:Domain of unknown function (DUF4382)